MKKLPFELGEVLTHKVDGRKMVVIGYTYPSMTTTLASLGQGAHHMKKVKAKQQEPTSVSCRYIDAHLRNYTTGSFTFTELERQPKKKR